MKVKINKWLCPYGYIITLFGTIYVRNKNTYDRVIQPYSYIYNHESIHEKQANHQWIKFYLLYIWHYIKHIHWLLINKKAPYLFHPMEIEAYYNEQDIDYLSKPNSGKNWKNYKNIPYSIVKYFFNSGLRGHHDFYNFIHENLK